MSTAALPAHGPGAARPTLNPATMSDRQKFTLFGVMAFGQFMALLDIQIVAASLNSVQAGLSAGPDEIAWVQTAYLMAEIVMIPLAAFLSQALSTRWLFAGSAALFTLSSLLCGLATDIESMIAFRAIQGFVGGAMIPTVFATGFTIFEGPKRAAIPAILGVVSTLAPTLGPTVGGWITEVASWRWLFFMNVLPGILITVLVPILGRIDTPNFAMLRRIDWLHVLSLALFLGGLQYVLEEGPRYEWFSDPAVATAGWVSLVGAAVFFERAFFAAHPVVKLTAFRRPTFALACGLNIGIGFGLYAATYMMPVFLGRVRDYTSLDIGTTVFVTGIFMLLGAPIAARLSTKADPRIVETFGLTGFAAGLWLLTWATPDWGFWELFLPQALRGFSILLCIVPSVGLALNGLPPAELRQASGLFNLMRNLGGAVGIALANTWLTDLAREHSLRLGEAMGRVPAAAGEMMAGMVQRMGAFTADPALAELMARAAMGRTVARQALTLAFNDVFFLMACVLLATLVLVPFCKPAPYTAGPPPDAH